MRYFIEFSYLGSNYHGWQIQPNAITIQEVLENSMSKILNYKINLIGCGRTDSGVHSKQMFAHFDLESSINNNFLHKINSFLPKDIAINRFFAVNIDSHARFDAKSRTYEYYMSNIKNPFELGKTYYYKNDLDIIKMNESAKVLLNYTDFKCFSKSKTDVKTFNCKIFEANWVLLDNSMVFKITANRFLRNMVRAIVGTLIEVGLGRISIKEFESIIIKRDRTLAGFSVPAHGLYLKKIKYDWKEILLNGKEKI